jgi:hypothetical protein
MSAAWDEFNRRAAEWRQVGDTQRLRMAATFQDAFRYRETQPEQQLTMLTRCRDEARRLNEPWCVLFFDLWRLSTITADLHDFARALPLAIELLLRVNRPEARDHPCRVEVHTEVLYTYLQVDPVGYREDLERGFAYLDEQVPPGPVSQRFVLLYRWTEYLRETERWEEAHDFVQRFFELVDGSGPRETTAWWRCWVYFLLCEICNALGRVDELAAHAADMVELSQKNANLIRTRASGCIWRAVAERTAGEDRSAARTFRRGIRYLENLESRDEICADAVSRYYEIGEDWNSAVGVRDRELAVVARKGMRHRCCRVQIERCRLLVRAGAVTPADIDDARSAAAGMRVPGWYLERLARIGQ